MRLVAVADPAAGPRGRAAEELGVPAYAGLEELLREAPPAILVVATPPEVREEPVLAAARHATVRAIAVEKPLALELETAERMVAACSERDVLLVVGHQLVFVPAYAALADTVADGALGELELLRASAHGDLLDQGPHVIDAVCRLAGGRRVQWVMSQRGDAAADRARVSGNGSGNGIARWMTHYLAFEGGLRAVLETGPLHQRGRAFVDDWLDKRVVALGADGVGEAHAAGPFRLLRAASPGWEVREGGLQDYVDATTALHAATRDALLTGAPHPTEARGALHGLEVLLACAQSARDGDAAVLPLARGEAPTVPAATLRATPDVTVVLALPDHRGYAEEAVASWTRGQTLAADRFEVILVGDGREPEVEACGRDVLRPGDRLLRRDGAHEIVLYDAGARAARAPLVLFTEPHCIAEPDCLEELLAYLARTGADGACCRSLALGEKGLAPLEERLFETGFREWSRGEHWCRVILRGIAVRRDAYLDAGGFDPAYDRFAEYVLAARLHRRGRRIGYAPGAAVRHAYTESLGALVPAVADFSRGECAYRAAHPEPETERYFGVSEEWVRRRERDPALARALVRAGVRALLRPGTWRWRGAPRAVLGATARRVVPALAGAAPERLRARAVLAVEGLRARAPWRRPARRLDAYLHAYQAIVRAARLSWLAEHRPGPAPLPARSLVAIADLPDDRCVGFHAPERDGERAWRWAGALAALELPAPDGARGLRLNTGGVRPDGAPPLAAYLGGRRLRVRPEAPGVLCAAIPRDAVRRDGTARLVLVAVPYAPWRRGSPDRRELGVPLVSVEFVSR